MRSKLLLLSAFFCVILFSVVSCNKHDDHYMASGTITGYDLRQCACCGGLMIEIDGLPADNGQNLARIANDAQLGFSYSDTYPKRIRFDYIELQAFCGGRTIEITRLRRE
jgi:hypothetical protein